MDISDEVKYIKITQVLSRYDIPQQWKNQPISSKERNLDPFKKMNWKNLYDANKS